MMAIKMSLLPIFPTMQRILISLWRKKFPRQKAKVGKKKNTSRSTTTKSKDREKKNTSRSTTQRKLGKKQKTSHRNHDDGNQEEKKNETSHNDKENELPLTRQLRSGKRLS